MGAHRGQLLSEVAGLEPLLAVLPQPKSGRFDYQEGGRGHFLNVRYIPELDWYLLVEKRETPGDYGDNYIYVNSMADTVLPGKSL